jgi:NDP-sugar pyrophosphorylase family protein
MSESVVTFIHPTARVHPTAIIRAGAVIGAGADIGAGKAGYALEQQVGSAAAGGMIYRASTGRWPDFYATNEEALADIRRQAEADPLPATEEQ